MIGGNKTVRTHYKNQEGIKLQNIDLSKATLIEQMAKVHEEDKEFVEAIIKADTDNAIEEFWDLIQSRLGLLEKLGTTAQKVMDQYPKHLEKLKNRPRD
jgi:phosphoribosyl-ATP pyrophosphohydrolase